MGVLKSISGDWEVSKVLWWLLVRAVDGVQASELRRESGNPQQLTGLYKRLMI